MKQIIPFNKDITFKTSIGELTSISLDNDLELKGEDLISGNFYIKGTYKMTVASAPEEYSYKIPCEIAISDKYDTYNSTIDIDDFNYEIINDETLRVDISVLIDNLEEKEIVEEEIPVMTRELEVQERIINPVNVITESKPEILETTDETYLTYSVYLVREEDTIEKIIEKYKVTKEELSDYNSLEEFKVGMKLVIPSYLND